MAIGFMASRLLDGSRCAAGGQEFERSVFEMGRICLQAMLQSDPNIRRQGYQGCFMILQPDSREDYISRFCHGQGWVASDSQREWGKAFSLQLGWVAWHIANKSPNTADMKTILESLGAAERLAVANNTHIAQEEVDVATHRLVQCLTFNGNGLFPWFRSVLFTGTDDRDLLLAKPASISPKPTPRDQICFNWVAQNDLATLRHWLQ